MAGHHREVVRKTGCAAAGSNHLPAALPEVEKRRTLERPKGVLSLFGKDARDRLSSALGDDLVEVDEANAEAIGDAFSDGGLARSHEPNEKNIVLKSGGCHR